jgi:NAD(P)-dependent dehydrogenase (short-subunit alcohol dehydrogenase family)
MTAARQVALITGGNTGLGRVTARELAKAGFHVFIACRSAERAGPVLDEVRAYGGADSIELLALDLGNFDSVRQCARTFLDRGLPLHLLINNAGLAGARGLTRSGFELAFGVNHVGHFVLTQLLTERIRSSGPARIVTVASTAHYQARGIDWQAVRRPTSSRTGMPEYSVSKLCNVLFSAELARRLAGTGVSTYSLHPGVVATDIWRRVPWPVRPLIKLAMISADRGAATTLFCATSPAAGGQTGRYYDNCRPRQPSLPAQDSALGAELWKRSEEWAAAAS